MYELFFKQFILQSDAAEWAVALFFAWVLASPIILIAGSTVLYLFARKTYTQLEDRFGETVTYLLFSVAFFGPMFSVLAAPTHYFLYTWFRSKALVTDDKEKMINYSLVYLSSLFVLSYAYLLLVHLYYIYSYAN